MTAQAVYERAKSQAIHADPAVRVNLARRTDIQPEILYFLADDAAPEVRREIAANEAAPVHASLVLARDKDEGVRCRVAETVVRLLPHLEPGAAQKLGAIVGEILETLAHDSLPRVRRVLSESLKEVTSAPESVIRDLAHDSDIDVAAPVLEFSPLLGADVLVEIVNSGAVQGVLQAIARREGLGADVADAIVARNDEGAITALLTNRSAQIREETLDSLVERASDRPAWHEPLVLRPKLSPRAARRLATFVADSLVETLMRRNDLDAETAQAVQATVRTRLAREDAAAADEGASSLEAALLKAKKMAAAGEIDDEAILDAIGRGQRAFVMAALAVMAKVEVPVVEKVVSLASAKGMTAVVWKAGFNARLAWQLQMNLLRLPPTSVLKPRDGDGWPLSEEDMRWQLEFFGAA